MNKPEKPAWFAPKSFGYGAGLPIVWQGWALLGGYVALLAGLGWLAKLPGTAPRVVAFAVFVAATATLFVVARNRTQGGWHWRWGSD